MEKPCYNFTSKWQGGVGWIMLKAPPPPKKEKKK